MAENKEEIEEIGTKEILDRAGEFLDDPKGCSSMMLFVIGGDNLAFMGDIQVESAIKMLIDILRQEEPDYNFSSMMHAMVCNQDGSLPEELTKFKDKVKEAGLLESGPNYKDGKEEGKVVYMSRGGDA